MDGHNVKSFTFYLEYADLISLLTEEEQANLYLKIINYIFYEKEVDKLTDNQKKVWINLKRPIDKSIIQSKNVTKRYTNEDTKKSTKQLTKLDTNEDTKKDTHNMSIVNVNSNMSNVNNLEKIECEEEKPFRRIIEYLNSKLGTKYRYTNKSTQSKINARLNEGYNLDDFIVVIDKMCLEWSSDEKMKAYLRPETLFGTKFESYLNRPTKKLTTKDIKITQEEITDFFR